MNADLLNGAPPHPSDSDPYTELLNAIRASAAPIPILILAPIPILESSQSGGPFPAESSGASTESDGRSAVEPPKSDSSGGPREGTE